MNLLDLIIKTRSYRRFDESHTIESNQLKALVQLAGLASSARNAQALRYKIIDSQKDRDSLFPLLAWAGYLTEWPGPELGERPTAYIIVVHDTVVNPNIHCDDGLAIQNILLGATEQGLGGCILGAFDKEKIKSLFGIEKKFDIKYIIALGKPTEKVVIEEVQDNNIRYWRDENGVHHVPKRNVEDILI